MPVPVVVPVLPVVPLVVVSVPVVPVEEVDLDKEGDLTFKTKTKAAAEVAV